MKGQVCVEVFGDAGNCFANLLDGPRVTVHGSCEDDLADTMQSGDITVMGDAGDVACQAMQGGTVVIRGGVLATGLAYRCASMGGRTGHCSSSSVPQGTTWASTWREGSYAS
ncbi:hypothetical protein [Thermogymnomonas acidicola]|uniref:hypothetical protein n=1 Tax=Thermogymnomonas acidicola TaxID=399579 RepID=UPI0009465986|nr:hypothetical protein [Thermogymnomonas acidicola]